MSCCWAQRRYRHVGVASGPEAVVAISSDAHHDYFLSPTCQLVFPEIFPYFFLFFSTKFTACICRDKRPWAWVRWTFAVLLKMVVKENYASRRLKRESVEPFQLFEAIRYSEKEREREGVLV